MSRNNTLVTLAIYPSEVDAHVAKTKLDAAGIDSFVFKDDEGGANPFIQLAQGVRLKVKNSDLDLSQELLGIQNNNKKVGYNPKNDKKTLFSLGGILIAGVGLSIIGIGAEYESYMLTFLGITTIVLGIFFEIYSVTQ